MKSKQGQANAGITARVRGRLFGWGANGVVELYTGGFKISDLMKYCA